ncbi:MAG TPA: DNA primase catalytic subunit PriS [Thermoplasmatales archaeon]|nr:DNA primase catalytic subunit PriS [Thermoplasmatales archaeon]
MNFLRKKFLEYYLNPKIDFPVRFDRREYAFILFEEDTMHRHISFKSKEDLLLYLKTNVPAHAYYSSAYYRNPSAETMQEKQWMGADLIFDLDADHLPNANNMSYEEALRAVKEELEKLIDFLIEDFGFGEDELEIYFSGGRGYHCHVHNKKVLDLGSQERREIVDYLTGRGLDFKEIIKEKRIGGEITIEIDMEGGWEKRIADAIIQFFEDIRKMEKEKAIKKLMEIEGVGNKTAEDVYNSLTAERMRRIKAGLLDQATAIKKILKPLVKKVAVSLYSQTDEPVTADIKRLIRLPGSLHGKTGFRVTKVNVDKIEEFEPLRDAVVFKDNKVKIKVEKPFKIKMMDEEYDLKKGVAKVPEYLAVFAIARKFATIG